MNVVSKVFGFGALACFVALPSFSSELPQSSVWNSTIVIIRQPNGIFLNEDLALANSLVGKARTVEYVVLWVTLGVPFQPDVSQLSPEQYEQQSTLVETMARSVMEKLIRQRVADYASGNLVVKGQGFRVKATARGVRELLEDPLVIQLVDET